MTGKPLSLALLMLVALLLAQGVAPHGLSATDQPSNPTAAPARPPAAPQPAAAQAASYFLAVDAARQAARASANPQAAALAARLDAALAALLPPIEQLAAGQPPAPHLAALRLARAELAQLDQLIRQEHAADPGALDHYLAIWAELSALLDAVEAPGADPGPAAARARDMVTGLLPQAPPPPAPPSRPPPRDAGAPRLDGLAPLQAASPDPGPADRAATVDVQLTDEIRALAASLDNDPLRIYSYVRNRLAFEPYYGSLKGSTATLWSEAGNAYDQASLLIALLRSSDLPARYVTGIVTVSAEAAQAWLGTNDLPAAVDSLRRAGVAARLSPAGLQLDHAWVIAYLPVPEVGGSAWLPLDPSFKLREARPGVSLPASVAFDREAFLAQIRPELAGEFYADQVRAYLQASRPGTSLADLSRWGPIVPAEPARLPASLPYTVDAVSGEYSALPAGLRYSVDLTLTDLTPARNPLLSRAIPLPELGPATLSIAFTPAASEVTPRLLRDDEQLAAGPAIFPSSAGELITRLIAPGAGQVAEQRQTVLNMRGVHTIALDMRQAGPRLLAERGRRLLAAQAQGAATPAARERLDAAILGLAQARYMQRFAEAQGGLAGMLNIVPTREVEVFIGTLATYNQHLFLPTPPVFTIDLPGWFYGFTTGNNNPAAARAGLQILGLSGSALEHQIWEELVERAAVSTVKLLQYAGEVGNPIYRISQQNSSDLSKVKDLSIGAALSIAQDLSRGRTIIIHQDRLTFDARVAGRDLEWRGHGWISEDPAGVEPTGFLISGSPFVPPTTNAAAIPPAPTMAGGSSSFSASYLRDLFDGLLGQATDKALASTSEPVTFANGNLYHQEADLEIAAPGLPLRFVRTYNSQSSDDGPFGVGWRHSFQLSLDEADSGDVTFTAEGGSRHLFVKTAQGYSSPYGLFLTLSKGAGGFTLRDRFATTWTFNSAGRLTEISDRNGNSQTLSYSGGRLASVADPAGRELRLSYNGAGRISAVTDFTGRRWSYSYSGSSLAAVRTPSDTATPAYTTSYSYFTEGALRHNLRTITDARGAVTSFSYYQDDRVFQTVEPEGRTNSFFYLPLSGETHVLTDRGTLWRFRYNQHGYVTRITRPDGSVIARGWDARGNLAQEGGGSGATWRYSYDQRGNRLSETDPLGNVFRYSYDPSFSQLTGATDARGNRATITLDARGNTLSVTDPAGQITRYSYDQRGSLTSITNAAGRVSSLSYDASGYLTAVRDPRGNSWGFGRDDLGRLTERTTPLGHTTSYAYDILGRLVRLTDPNGGELRLAYDGRGNITGVIGLNEKTTTISYDGLGYPTEIRDPLGQSWRFSYVNKSCVICLRDTRDLAALTDPAGNTRRFSYDGLDRLVEAIDPLGQARRLSYDGAGNLVALRDPAGQVTRYTYDLAGRLTARLYADGRSDSYSYDANGNLTAATNSVTSLTFGYNSRNQLIQARDSALDKTVGYSYDPVGNRAALTLPDGRSQQYSYDPSGNLATVRDADGLVSQLTYDADERLTRLAPGAGQPGPTAAFAYDPGSRLTRITYTAGGAALLDLTLQYDPAGNLTGRTAAGLPAFAGLLGQSSFAYDDLGRLVSATLPGAAARAFAYDSRGNRTGSAGAASFYDEADRLTYSEAAGAGYAYDTRGNLTTKTVSGQTTTYVWDAAGRLSRVLYPDGTQSSYAYDALGRRALVTRRDGTRVRYLHDGRRILQEYDGARRLQATYVHGGDLDRPLRVRRGAQTLFYLQDQLGSALGLSDGSGKLAASYLYGPWGEPAGGAAGATPNPYRFAGLPYDESGLSFFRARYYDPAAGRFISPDPIGIAGGLNLYAYAENSPLSRIDPLGLNSTLANAKGLFDQASSAANTVRDYADGVKENVDRRQSAVDQRAEQIYRERYEHLKNTFTEKQLRDMAYNDAYRETGIGGGNALLDALQPAGESIYNNYKPWYAPSTDTLRAPGGPLGPQGGSSTGASQPGPTYGR